MSRQRQVDPSPFSVTLHQERQAVDTLIHRMRHSESGRVLLVPTLSAAVGRLAYSSVNGALAESLASNVDIDLFFIPDNDDEEELNLHTARARLVKHLEEEGDFVRQSRDGHPIMRHGAKQYRVVLEALPAWFRQNKHNLSRTDYLHPTAELSSPTLLLLLLLDVVKLQHGPDRERLNCAISLLYVLSVLGGRAHWVMDKNKQVQFDWTHETWAQRFSPAETEPLRALLRGPGLGQGVIEDWAAWLVRQPGYDRVDDPFALRADEAKLTSAMKKFLDEVAGIVFGRGHGTSEHSLGKAGGLPVGMAVFHPDSARRREHRGAWGGF